MDIVIVGVGYVGLVTGACFAELGNTVYCVDKDPEKMELLRHGELPIYEPHLAQLVARNRAAGRLYFAEELADVLQLADVLFIAVGTPMSSDGSADLTAVFEVAAEIGQHLSKYLLIVNKSTVPVGTADRVKEIVAAKLAQRKALDICFDVASNPEFLKEGAAIDDFMKPDRVVVGVETEKAREIMTRLYKPMLLNNFRVLFMDVRSAEMTKYAANAMLATRISFMNELANLCERVGASVSSVRNGIGSDSRIGNRFLYAGCGYGGSCLPKDVRALECVAKENGLQFHLLDAVQQVNELQKTRLFAKFYDYFSGNIAGRRVAIWGLAFKPGTDDMREAPSLTLIRQLLEGGCLVQVYDPVAMPVARKILGESVVYGHDIYDTAMGVSAIFHVTEWKEYRMPDWRRLASLVAEPLLIDGRNVFEVADVKPFCYLHIG